jgi:phytoene synthase
MTREELVARAQDAIHNGSKSFRLASRLFDRRTRERAWLLYCWCRHCDDMCDGQALGRGTPQSDSIIPLRGSVIRLTEQTRRAALGQSVDELPFQALQALLRECPIPLALLDDHLEGFRLDERDWRPETEEELIRYCYHVAGTVGRMMALVMGVPDTDEATLERAQDLGIAFQLSNIARDVREDAEAGRCYLPAEWLREFDLGMATVDLEENRRAVANLVHRLIDSVERYERSARLGVPTLPFRSRWAVLSAAGIYGRIGRTVADLGPRAWDRRVVVPRSEKAMILAAAFGEAMAA